MSTKSLDELYADMHEIEDIIKNRLAEEARKKKQLLIESRNKYIMLRLGIQHREDVVTMRIVAVVAVVIGIGLGLFIAWIF